jgi:predicted Zn finger-like uncharacterized protein
MEPEDITCPECDAKFYVVWNNMAETQGGPDYCPFCGETINYAANIARTDQ